MAGRTRTRTRVAVHGTYGYVGQFQTTRDLSFRDVCADTVGNYHSDNALQIDHFRGVGAIMNSRISVNNGALIYLYQSVPMFNLVTNIPSNPFGPDVSQSFVNRLLASSGPLTPRINVPLFIFELRELPRMLKDTGDYLHGLRKRPRIPSDRDVAAQTLAYQFGWGPLVGDIVKMLSFVDTVKKRQDELRKANSSRGLKRRVTLDPMTEQTTESKLAWSASPMGGITVTCVTTHTRESWATCRWNLRSGQNIGRDPTFSEAFNAALGLNRGMIPIDVWKSLPWSWAIDWFADISNLLQANYNMIYYSPGKVCIMNRIKSEMAIPEYGTPTRGLIFTSGTRTRETLYRTVVSNPSSIPTLRVPFLDSFKLSILGSFTILRIRGRR